MPELPEVETVRRQVIQTRGQRVTKVGVDGSSRFVPALLSEGREITDVRRLGKYLLFDLDDGQEMVVHLGMTGVLALGEQDTHVRVRWELSGGGVMTLKDPRKFGKVLVVPRSQYAEAGLLGELGQEPLSASLDRERFAKDMARSKAPVKAVLLSQKVVAGVGNIYADEALWASGVHPEARALSREDSLRLLDAIVVALEKGLVNGGTTLKDYRNALGGSGSNQERLLCYGRAGEECRRCGGVLVRSIVAGRGTTHCPVCQPAQQTSARAE